MRACRSCFCLALVLMAFVAGEKLAASEENLRRAPRNLESLPSVVAESCEAELESALRVPPGTETWYEGKALRFKVPSGYVVWTRTNDGSYIALEEGGVECSCAGGGCDPVSQGGEIGCLIKPSCSSGCCTRKATAQLAVVVTEALGMVRRATPEEVRILPLAPPELVDVPEIAEAVKSYVDRAYAGRERASLETRGNRAWAPPGHVLVPVNVYGYLANVLVPASAKCEAELASAKCDEEGGEAARCRCNEGTGCKYWSKPFVGVSGCDSGSCSRCEMIAN